MSGFHSSAHPAATARLTSEAHAEGTNLAMPRTSFLGREQERQQLTGLLTRPDLRLLTLTGPGGIGKSRLAHQVLEAVQETFAGDTVFIPLAPVLEAPLVLPTVAQILGVPDTETPLASRLQAYLTERHLLLVLDNAEHLLDAVADLVASLLGTCPRVTVLVTSRVRLGLSGEQVVPLGTFDSASARALFVARAQAVTPAFAVTAETKPVLDAICMRLDYLPLAIELAAARANVLPLPALLRRLDHQLDVLTGGPRDAPARQRTMRDSIAWSHDLLPDAEQVLYRRLGVFVGGFTLDAAEAVAAGQDVLACVSALVSSSLVVVVNSPDDEPRFSMLETIREDALERLWASGEAEPTHRSHLRFFEDRAERFLAAVSGRERTHLLRKLQPEVGNIRAALAWGLEHEPVEAARLAGSLDFYWIVNGLFAEGRMWVEGILTTSSVLPPAVRIRLLHTAGWLAKDQNDLVTARKYLTEAVDEARSEGDDALLITAVSLLGTVALSAGDVDTARQLHEEQRALAEATGKPVDMAVALVGLGRVSAATGDLPQAQWLFEAALAAHQNNGTILGAALARLFLGRVLSDRGDHTTAIRHLRGALQVFTDLADWANAARTLEGIAAAMVHARPEVSARLLGAAVVMREQIGYPRDPLEAPAFERTRATARSSLRQNRFTAEWEAGKSLPIHSVLGEIAALPTGIEAPHTGSADPHGLTRREREVLRLLAEGRSNRAIADALSISERTVENHVLHILTKLELESRTAAATYAVRQRLV